MSRSLVRLSCALAASAALLMSCVPRPAPAPTPPPPARPVAPPPAPPAPPPLDWQDAPVSEGDWVYRDEARGASAAFGNPGAAAFTIRCDAGRRISLARTSAGDGALIVRTTFGERALPATLQSGALVATVNASDPLLDSIAFSRGRFAVEAPGAPLLIIPAWPEPARVIEDCRQ